MRRLLTALLTTTLLASCATDTGPRIVRQGPYHPVATDVEIVIIGPEYASLAECRANLGADRQRAIDTAREEGQFLSSLGLKTRCTGGR